jgi:MFS family permease
MKTSNTQRILLTFTSDNRHLLWIGLFTFLIIYLSSFVKGYGYFIDEPYYIACALNPAFGYVDHPPLAPLILTVFQFVFGTSVYAIRVLPALAQAVSVVLTGILAKEIGGGRFAQVLAACAMVASPTILAFGGFYSMNAFELLFAIGAMYYTVRMIKENNTKRWIVLGVLMGLGMMNKHTFGVFAIALVFSLLIAGKWKLVANRWFLVGALCGFVIFLPNILWQVAHNYPSLEFYKNITELKNVYTPPLAFIAGQIQGMSPFTVPIWLGGIFFVIFFKGTREFRFLSALFVSLFLFMMISGTSRSDRLMFTYPAVFAGGGMMFEALVVKYNARWLKGVLVGLLFAGTAMVFPVVLPCLSYEQVQAYTEFLGVNTEIERGKKPPLPQLLADRIGWEEKVDLVVRAYQGLTDEDKREAIIAAGNYGQAGAIEVYGKKYGLPPVVCGHNTYYLWSKDRLRGSIVLRLTQAENYDGLKERFESVEPCDGEFSSPYVSSHENHLKVFVCRGPKIPFPEMLERGKFYY